MKVSLNPTVLEWAIRDAGSSTRAVAKLLDVPTATLDAWVAGSDQPLLGQLRKLAAVLQRTPSFFFLPAPPTGERPAIAFRAAPNQPVHAPSPETRTVLRETHGMQEFLAWLTRELQLGAAHLPEITRSTQPHVAAAMARTALGIDDADQKAWKDETTALRGWRIAIEGLGVSVFLTSVAEGPKGFSVADTWNPVIAVNTHKWNTGARIFTLAHELAHLLRGSSSSCMAIGQGGDDEERWCDRFAAALLMPWPAVTEELAKHGWDGRSKIGDFEVVRRLARRFKVSLLAAAVRLVQEEVGTGSLITQVPAASNLPGRGWNDPEKSRRPHRRLQQFGRRTVKLLKRAVDQEIVTKHEALSRLGCNYDEFDQIVAKAEAS